MLSLGEAKWGEVIGERHVDRLRRARDLLTTKGYDTRDTLLTCYGGAGLSPAWVEQPATAYKPSASRTCWARRTGDSSTRFCADP